MASSAAKFEPAPALDHAGSVSPDIYAEWLRRQGQQVVRSASSYWHSQAMGVYQAFPYHWLITPSREELRHLMLDHHAIALRYSAPAQANFGSTSYHAVYTASDYDFEALSAWARKNVRRGLRCCSVGPISWERYINEGWELRVDTLARQGRRLKESRDHWRRRYSAAACLEGFEVWAAEVGGRLGATLVTCRMENWYYLLYQQCHRDYLREHVNNALSFIVTQLLIRRPQVSGIFYGMQSLDAPASVDEFKFRMGYRALPVRQSVVLHPYVAPLANALSHRLSQALLALDPGSRRLAKAEGMLRIYLDTAASMRSNS